MTPVPNKFMDEERTEKITEVYTKPVPKMACVRRWFARDIVEMDFAELFEVKTYQDEVEIGKRKRKMCSYTGNFTFAPEVEVSVYEGDRFARVYLKYNSGVEEEDLKEVRRVLKDSGLRRRLGLPKN